MKSLLLFSLVCFYWRQGVFAFRATTLPSSFGSTRISAEQGQGRTTLYANKDDPQVFASGYSPKLDLHEAIQEATASALQALPKPIDKDSCIDLALITISSLYDGQSQPSIVVPAVLSSASVYGNGVQNLIGCTTGGIIASTANLDSTAKEDSEEVQPRACTTIESEGVPGVSVTLCLLPDVNVKVRVITLAWSVTVTSLDTSFLLL